MRGGKSGRSHELRRLTSFNLAGPFAHCMAYVERVHSNVHQLDKQFQNFVSSEPTVICSAISPDFMLSSSMHSTGAFAT